MGNNKCICIGNNKFFQSYSSGFECANEICVQTLTRGLEQVIMFGFSAKVLRGFLRKAEAMQKTAPTIWAAPATADTQA